MPSERRRKPNLRSRPNTPPPPPPGQTPPSTPRSTSSTPRGSPRPDFKPPMLPWQQDNTTTAGSDVLPAQPKRPAPLGPSPAGSLPPKPPIPIGVTPATPPPRRSSHTRPQVNEVTATPPPPPTVQVIDVKGHVSSRMSPREQKEKKKFSMNLFKKK